MMRKKYQILLFENNTGTCRTFSLRLWVCLLIAGIFLSSLTLNVFFSSNITPTDSAQARLEMAQRDLENQQRQFLALTEKIKDIEGQVLRIADFNAKVRVMANLDPGHVPATTSLGGADRMNFSEQYLTAHRQELLVRKMHGFLEQLHAEAKLEVIRQEELLVTLRDNQSFFAFTPSIWPTEGWVTSEFGYRRSPFTDRRELHKGLDIAGPVGTPIYATANGRVLSAERDGAYGLTATIDHGAGVVTLYAHMHRLSVEAGQEVSRGELIGHMGATGRTTGPHLHYEVRLNGIPVDPMRYILN